MSMNAWAARIGPTVWDDEGPIPILNRSTTLTKFADMPGILQHEEVRGATGKAVLYASWARAGISVAPSTDSGF